MVNQNNFVTNKLNDPLTQAISFRNIFIFTTFAIVFVENNLFHFQLRKSKIITCHFIITKARKFFCKKCQNIQ